MIISNFRKKAGIVWRKHASNITPKDRYPIVKKHEAIVKNIVHTTFKNLTDHGLIKFFSEGPYSKEGFLKVICMTAEEEDITIKFCLSKNPTEKKYFVLESSSHVLLVRIKPNIGQKDFEEKFKSTLDTHMAGFRNEKKFLKLLCFLKENCEKKNILSVKEAKTKSDKNGSDFIIDYRDSFQKFHSMRLQLKSSNLGQKKHKKKFPDIPSIVWTAEKYPDDKEAFRKIDKLMTNYSNGVISHL